MIHRRFVLKSARGEPIRGDLRLPDLGGSFPVVVVCHGFKGFKDWGFHPYLGSRLADAGFAAVHFNFSRNGVGEDLLEFTELDLFQRNTPTIEREDLGTVLAALRNELSDAPLDLDRIGLAGHSRGGGIAVLGAAADPAVKALVTWAAVSTLDQFRDPLTLALWRKHGYLDVTNTRTGQEMRLGVELLDDLTVNREALDVRASAARLRCPWRIVHGTADESVPFSEAEDLLAHASRTVPVELVPIEGAGHTFGAKHPWSGTTDHLDEAVRVTVDWFGRHLAPRRT